MKFDLLAPESSSEKGLKNRKINVTKTKNAAKYMPPRRNFQDIPPGDDLSNAHGWERNLGLSPDALTLDPLMDQFLSSFACTIEWRRSIALQRKLRGKL